MTDERERARLMWRASWATIRAWLEAPARALRLARAAVAEEVRVAYQRVRRQLRRGGTP